MRQVVFSLSDIDLFDQDLSPSDYDFFKKHTGAFKNMLEDQSKEKKNEFVEKFKIFALNNGCMRGTPSKNENRQYLDEAIARYRENFVNGNFSAAKSIVMDAVILAQNRHNLHNMRSNSFSNDPFFHKETRDTFRRLFGEPKEKGTCFKIVCVLPLHIKFGGSICRYLRRWLDSGDPEPVKPQLPISSTKNSLAAKATTKTNKKKEKEEKKKPHIAKIVRKELEMEELNHQFLKLVDHPRNYGFEHQIINTDKKSDSDDSAGITKAMDVLPREEGLSLSEYFGFYKKISAENPSGEKFVVETSDSSSNTPKKQKSEEEKLYDNACEFLVPKEHAEEENDEDERDKAPLGYDMNYEEVRKMFLLGKPHPNVEFEQLTERSLSKEEVRKLKRCEGYAKKIRDPNVSFSENMKAWKENHTSPMVAVPEEKPIKRHACANCRIVEPEPRKFKKCQRCHGKRTRFYCSRKCQEEDWTYRHNEDHKDSIEDVT